MSRFRRMIQLVRNGYIGKLERIDTWCRDMSFDVGQYHGKPYGSSVEVPVPADLDFDATLAALKRAEVRIAVAQYAASTSAAR